MQESKRSDNAEDNRHIGAMGGPIVDTSSRRQYSARANTGSDDDDDDDYEDEEGDSDELDERGIPKRLTW